MRKIFLQFFWLVLFFLVFIGFGASQFVVPEPDGYVTDAAGVVSDEEEAQLESLIYNIYQNTDIEIAVLFVNSLSGEAVWYAWVQVWEKWWVGDADKDNGVVILVSIWDREWTIQVWYGLEWTLPDAIAKRVGEDDFPTAFRAGDYAWWVYAGIQDLYKYIQADSIIVSWYNNDNSSAYNGDINEDYYINNYHSWLRSFFSIIIGIIYFFLWFYLADKYILLKRGSKNKKRKIKKWWWKNYFIIWSIGFLILFVLTFRILWSFVESFVLFLFVINLSMSPSTGWGSSGSWKRSSYSSPSSSSSKSSSSSSSSSSWSSFGGFSGWSFGGGGSSGKR